MQRYLWISKNNNDVRVNREIKRQLKNKLQNKK